MTLNELKEKLRKTGKLTKKDVEGLSEEELLELLLNGEDWEYSIRDGPENQY